MCANFAHLAIAPRMRYTNSMIYEQPMRRGVHLRPRLEKVKTLLGTRTVVADIGCDHGRLSIALLQSNTCEHVIATDISAPSLQKAVSLAALAGVNDRMDLRVGDGLEPLAQGEAEAVVLAGMGGTLMQRLLTNCNTPLQGAKLGVFQPMRAVADIRRYLYENNYHILDDVIVRDNGRLYQVFSAEPGAERDVLPDFWPTDFFDLGHRAFFMRDPLFTALAQHMLAQHEKRLQTAQGTAGGILLTQKVQALTLLLSRFGA